MLGRAVGWVRVVVFVGLGGASACAVVHFLAMNLRCQVRIVAGRTEKDLVPVALGE